MSSLDIVIVNWNSGEQLRDCLRSLAAAVSPTVVLRRVVVVDNASTDGSADGLDAMPLPLVLVRNSGNVGFARACNQGARGTEAAFLLFLNPDAAIEPDTLARALAHFEEPGHTRTGILGVQMVDATGAVARHCARFPTPWRLVGAAFGLDRVAPALCRPHFLSEWDHGSDREVDQVMGAFFLVRTAVFAELEGFDERFFVYFEDLDFARRARLRGWRSWYCAHARVFHAGGGTTGSIRGRRLHLVLRARLQYAVKHFSWAGTAAVFAATLLVEPWSRALHALRHRGRMGLRETLLGYRLLWSDLPVGRRARVPAR